MSETRKADHLSLALKSQVSALELNDKFYYEPLLAAHPTAEDRPTATNIFGKTLRAPLWISSMTGGTSTAKSINENLAKVAKEFGLGMGLGSCRGLITGDKFYEDFNLRPILGDETPFYANIGIAQLEQLIENNKVDKLHELVEKLQADGLFIHVNPLQEWFQPEGDKFKRPAIETIEDFISNFLQVGSYPIIVKEVGQGMGPQSLKRLLQLPLAGIDFGAFGGTNFSQLEVFRRHEKAAFELTRVGQTADEMITLISSNLNELGEKALCREFIISGGVQSFLHGHYLMEKLKKVSGVKSCVYGQGKAFLEHAHDLEELRGFVKKEIAGLVMAQRFLTLK